MRNISDDILVNYNNNVQHQSELLLTSKT